MAQQAAGDGRSWEGRQAAWRRRGYVTGCRSVGAPVDGTLRTSGKAQPRCAQPSVKSRLDTDTETRVHGYGYEYGY